jgi:CHAT domain-containing protein/tetratricopeptide (TPR) repeat protein
MKHLQLHFDFRARAVARVLLFFTVLSSSNCEVVAQSPADSAAGLIRAGLSAYRLGSQSAVLQSVQAFKAALPLLRRLNDSASEAFTLGSIGSAYASLGQTDSALNYTSRTLPILRATGERHAEGIMLNNMGLYYQHLGDSDSALVYFARALSVREDEGNHRGESETLFNLGSLYWAQGQADSARIYYARAVPVLHEVGEKLGEGVTLSNLGLAFQMLGHPDSALVYYARALPIRQQIGDRDGVSATLKDIGLAYATLNHSDSALVYYGRALAIQRDMGDSAAMGSTLTEISAVHLDENRVDSALVKAGQAVSILHDIGDRSGEAAALRYIGLAYRQQNRNASALLFYTRALALLRGQDSPPESGSTLSAIGSIYRELDRADSAMCYLRRALTIQQVQNDRRAMASTLSNLGGVYLGVGRTDSALVYYKQALAIQRELRDRHGKVATLGNIGTVYAHRLRFDSSFAYHRQAIALGGESDRAIAMGNMAAVFLAMNRPDSALVFAVQALDLFRHVGNVRGEETALSNIGAAFGLLNQPDSALKYDEQALRMAGARGTRNYGTATILRNIAYVYHYSGRAGNLRQAVAYYDSASAVIAEVGGFAGGDENRLSFTEQPVALYQQWALAWLARLPEVGRSAAAHAALAASEQGRAQALRELMRRDAPRLPIVPDNRATYTRLGVDLPAEGRALASTITRGGVPALSYLVTPDTVLGFLLLPGQEIEFFVAPLGQDTLAALIESLRVALRTDTADWAAPAARLSALLLPTELRARLPASGELVIIPSGPLLLLPFAALPLSQGASARPDSTSVLGLRYAVRYAPSLQVLADLEAQPRRVIAATTSLVVGNPAMPWVPAEDGSKFQLSQLDSAGVEGRWVADTLGTTELIGPAATEAAVRAQLGSATLVHLATHAMVYANDARVRDSYIALASGPGDAPPAGEDGMLTVGEVLDEVPEMRAELVVLSACETGLGDLKQAEGTVGLQRAFLAKGARSMLVSLWNVSSDLGTTSLMRSFYRYWLSGDTKAEALRRAQVEVARSFPHPRYWAAFQMIGAR